MKILFTLGETPDPYIASYVVHSAAAVARRGHEVVLQLFQANALPLTPKDVWARYRTRSPMRVQASRPLPQWRLGVLQNRFLGSKEGWRTQLTRASSWVNVAINREFRGFDAVFVHDMGLLVAGVQAGHPVAIDLGTVREPRSWQRPLARHWLKHRRFLGAIAHTQQTADAFEQWGVPRSRIRSLPPGFDPAWLEPRLDAAGAREQLSLDPERGIVVCAGPLDDRTFAWLRGMARRAPELLFMVVSASDLSAYTTAAQGLENIELVAMGQLWKASPYLFAADILLALPLRRDPSKQRRHKSAAQTIPPLESFLCLGAGRPLVASDEGFRDLLKHDHQAWLVPPDDSNAAVDGIGQLLKDIERYERLAQGARDRSRSLTWDDRAQRLESFLEEQIQRQN